jgi:3'(2'), 5'-bisphosphate nucleotidase
MNKKEIQLLINVVLESGEIALDYFNDKNIKVTKKTDNSPVTQADKKISKLIKETLTKNFPEISIICEENKNRSIIGDTFWLIDPIDGTKDFINKRNEFTINIGLIKNNIPIFGIVYAPKMPNAPLYYIDENKKLICFEVLNNKKREINPSKVIKKDKITIVTSKRCKNETINSYLQDNFPKINVSKIEVKHISSSFKFCELIEDRTDIFLNLEPTMEWDTAAGHALAIANQAITLNPDKTLLRYNKIDLKNNGFIAISRYIQEGFL